jgi:hypothetical protein
MTLERSALGVIPRFSSLVSRRSFLVARFAFES